MIATRKITYPSTRVAIDTECTGLNTYTGARPYIISWTWFDKAETSEFIRAEVDPYTRKVNWSNEQLKYIRAVLENPAISIVMHNAKFDLRMLESIGISVGGRIDDTFLMLRCMHNSLPSYGLKPICAKLLDYPEDDLKSLTYATTIARKHGKKVGWKVAEDIAPDYWMCQDRALVERYAVGDTIRAKRLFEWLENAYTSDTDSQRELYEKELQLLKVVIAMEKRGASIDPRVLQEEIITHRKNAEKQYAEFLRIGGMKEINLKSPKQMATLFYDKLKLPCETFTEKGNRSVNLEALKKWNHPLVKVLCEYKASKHALANFFDIYERESERVSDDNWVLHPDFRQFGTQTNRFACSKPNLQNVANNNLHKAIIPIQARRPFRPVPGYTWFAADYAQMEVWVFASLSNETLMIDALNHGRDLHTEVANLVWGHGKDVVSEEKERLGKSPTRILAKLLLFGLVYGIGPSSAMKLIGCTYEEAKKYLDDFRKAFPQMTKFMEEFSRKAEVNGFIHNAYGRRLYVDPDLSYMSVNYLVQGSCADMLKNKMIEVTALLNRLGVDGGIIMTIHDELIIEIANRFASKTLLLKIKDIMEDHNGKYSQFKKLKVEVSKIVSSGNWSQKEALVL